MKAIYSFLLLTSVILLSGCTPLTLKPVDFSWPIDAVVKPDSLGNVQHIRYYFAFNIKNLLFEELNDSSKANQYSIHMIRDRKGYYFMTAKDFKNVYVFAHKEDALVLEKKIFVSEKGLKAPGFNQDSPFIKLNVNEADENAAPIMLSENGIEKGTSK